ncbi:hypothetical protein HPP92_006954 [Vanilla planifolia]|uniref:Pentatricopeptide repeat-containing protein n=1 Tax=Vanilla planifolia TaxID=51239 RepID=A0A835RCY3_VANPL|nr:hypothetical protein HPP92_006954 [Vanilla planifolia]
MRRNPLCHLLISYYGSIRKPPLRLFEISSISLPKFRNSLHACSDCLEPKFGTLGCRGAMAANRSSIWATHQRTAISVPSLLIAAKHACSLASQFKICNTSSDGYGNATLSRTDKIYETIVSNSGSDKSVELALNALGLELTTELVNDVIHRLRYEEKLAFRFFTWVGRQDGYAHEHQTYNDMIEILSSTRYKMKQFGVACDILDYMKRNRKKSVPVEALLTILKSYAEKHLTHIGKLAKKRRVKPRIQPEVYSLNLLLDSLCKCSLIVEAEEIFRRVKGKVIPIAETYNILFFGWCRVHEPKKAMNVLEEMLDRGLVPESFTYNAAIDSFCSAGMIAEARELFEFMRTKGSTISSPTAKTYSVMIVALAKFDMMDECFKLLSDMRGCGCLPDVSTYKDLIEGMCLAGKIDAAYKILEEMAEKGYPPDILTYNCFLKVLCNLKKNEEALLLCEKMIEAGCEPSVHTYNMLITMFFLMEDADQAICIWNEMDKRGCTRSEDTHCIMIDGFFSCKRVEDACFLLEEVIDKGMKLPYKRFDALMARLSEVGNLHAIHRLSEHMRRFYNVTMARRFAISQKKKSMSLRRP